MDERRVDFPTSVNLYKRVLTDRNIQSCHVSIVYFDSVLNKMREKPISAWKEVTKGGDIPWHRVHYFKYKDEIVWDREKRVFTVEKMITNIDRNVGERFKIMTYNILNDKTLSDRTESILRFIEFEDPDVLCLQEMNDEFCKKLKNKFPNRNIVSTDLKLNNITFMTKSQIVATNLITINIHKQAINIILNNHQDVPISFVGIHLTSDYKSRAHDKRKEQLALILSKIDKSYPTFLLGDFNADSDEIDTLKEEYHDSAKKIEDEREILNNDYTYDPETNDLAKANTSTGFRRRFDRVYINKSYSVESYKVYSDNKDSDHYPLSITVNHNSAKDDNYYDDKQMKIVSENKKN
jgi:endonuclease/exonuclease/phosphatase family metal-dependent hydrolase